MGAIDELVAGASEDRSAPLGGRHDGHYPSHRHRAQYPTEQKHPCLPQHSTRSQHGTIAQCYHNVKSSKTPKSMKSLPFLTNKQNDPDLRQHDYSISRHLDEESGRSSVENRKTCQTHLAKGLSTPGVQQTRHTHQVRGLSAPGVQQTRHTHQVRSLSTPGIQQKHLSLQQTARTSRRHQEKRSFRTRTKIQKTSLDYLNDSSDSESIYAENTPSNEERVDSYPIGSSAPVAPGVSEHSASQVNMRLFFSP